MRATNKEEIDLICQKYQTGKYTVRSLAKEQNKNEKTITKFLLKNNISIDRTKCGRDFTINHNYFSIIDTEDKAYFLGLLYADGCNLKHRSVIKLTLEENDKHILDTLNEKTSSTRPLEYENKSAKNSKWKNFYTYRIHSKQMCCDLERLGCVPRKSLILEFPTFDQVPENLIRHFIRGYFDGDGSVTYTIGGRNKNSIILYVNIVSTENFLIPLSILLQKYIDIHCCIHHDKRVLNKPTRMLCITCNVARKFLNWIYKDCNLYLNRKRNRYLEIENERVSNEDL